MVKLFCTLASELDSAFSVELDENRTIHDLKVAINVMKPYTILCGSDKMQLHRAHNEEGWLGGQALKLDISRLELLEPPEKSLKCAGLGEDVAVQVCDDEIARGNGCIHVVVVVPNYRPCGLWYPDQLRVMADQVAQARATREVYSFSDCPLSKIDEVHDGLGLSMRLLPIVANDDNSVPGFDWNNTTYGQGDDGIFRKKIVSYITCNLRGALHLNEELDCQPQFSVEDSATTDLFTLKGAALLKIDVRGSADMIIVDHLAKKHKLVFAGLRFIIDAVKDLGADPDKFLRQFSLKLIVADFKRETPVGPVGLITDLNKCWYFLWFTKESEIVTLLLRCPAHGFQLINDVLAGRASPSVDRINELYA